MQICTIVFSYTALTASGRPLSLSSSALVVVLAGDVLAPAGLGPFVAGDGFGGGRAGYEVVGCGAVPVSFAGRGTDDVAGADFLDLAVAWLVEAGACGEVEGLADGVPGPCGAGRRGEPGGAYAGGWGVLALGRGLACR